MVQKPDYLNIAQIGATVGVHGEMKVRTETDDPNRLLGLKAISCLLPTGERLLLNAESVKMRKDGVVIAKFAGFDAPETAARLRQGWLQVPFAEARRQPGKVLYADMLGMAVVHDVTGDRLGTVTEVLRAGQDILEIRTPDDKEVLLPWVDAFVKSVDLATGEVRVTPLEGFFE